MMYMLYIRVLPLKGVCGVGKGQEEDDFTIHNLADEYQFIHHIDYYRIKGL